MKRYLSHKVVEAAPIQNIYELPEGGWVVGLGEGQTVHADAKLFARGIANQGDYLVRYADGHLSWSPKVAFEEGYAEFTESRKALTFGQAIELLKAGERVARAGWNGKDMWLALSGPLAGREIAFENFWSKPCSEYARLNGGSATVLPTINMKTATGEILMGWLASQTDMLAEDWMVV